MPSGPSSATPGTLLVFGAGASHGARSHPRPSPPLGNQLAGYLLDWLKNNEPGRSDPLWPSLVQEDEADPDDSLWETYDELRPLLERARDVAASEGGGFERVMSDLADASRVGLLNALNAVIASSFLGGRGCTFEEEIDLFDRLFAALEPRLRGIVTPNYDILSEEALKRLKIPYFAVGSSDVPVGVPIYKIHGSVNYVLPIGAGRGSTVEIAQASMKPLRTGVQQPFPSLYNDHPLYAIDGRLNARMHFNCHNRHGYYNVIVTYGPQKPLVYGLPHVQAIREQCAVNLRATPPSRIIAVGISPPAEDAGTKDDPAWSSLCSIFKSLPSRKEYWSGDAKQMSAMSSFGFEGRAGWLLELVETLESESEATTC
jgi:hypothetical protein